MQQTATQTADRLAPALASIDEAKAYLGGLGTTKLYELLKTGEITRVKIGRSAFVTVESLEAYVQRLQKAAA